MTYTIREQIFYDTIRALRGKLHDELPTTTAASLMYHAVLMARDLGVPSEECGKMFLFCQDRIFGGYTPPEELPATLYKGVE